MKQQRRSYGTGRLYVRTDAAGREAWYGKWRQRPPGQAQGRRQALRGRRDGLTRRQAEGELRRLIGATQVAPPVGERLTVADVSERYREHIRRKGRKRATLVAVRARRGSTWPRSSATGRSTSITPEDVADFIAALEAKGLAPKTICNVHGTLAALFNYAKAPRRRWATTNPCEGAELPAIPEPSEIRYLDLDTIDLHGFSRAPRAAERHRPDDVPGGPDDRSTARRARRAPVA